MLYSSDIEQILSICVAELWSDSISSHFAGTRKIAPINKFAHHAGCSFANEEYCDQLFELRRYEAKEVFSSFSETQAHNFGAQPTNRGDSSVIIYDGSVKRLAIVSILSLSRWFGTLCFQTISRDVVGSFSEVVQLVTQKRLHSVSQLSVQGPKIKIYLGLYVIIRRIVDLPCKKLGYFSDAHNVTTNSPTWTSFVTTTAITCNADTVQLKCPPRMHIQPVSVNAHPEIPPSASIPGAVSPKCFWTEGERGTYNQVYRRYSSKCLRTDAHMVSHPVKSIVSMFRRSKDFTAPLRQSPQERKVFPEKMMTNAVITGDSHSEYALDDEFILGVHKTCDVELCGSREKLFSGDQIFINKPPIIFVHNKTHEVHKIIFPSTEYTLLCCLIVFHIITNVQEVGNIVTFLVHGEGDVWHVRHNCEGRYSCTILGSQLQDNSTDCEKYNFPIRIDYQCLPDPDTTLFEAICADTYMDVKCDGRSLAVAVLAARLEQKIDQIAGSQRPGCQIVPGDGLMPPEWIVMNKQSVQLSEPKKRSKTQRLPKGAISNKLMTNPEETRHNRYKMNDQTNLKPDTAEDEEEISQDIRKTPAAEPNARDSNPQQLTSAVKLGSGKSIFQPLFIGLGVGAAILLLGSICLIVFCQNHRIPTHRLKQSHDDSKMHHKSQDNRTCSSSCNSTWHKHSVGCPHDQHWAELNRHCHTCLLQDETRPQCSPVELSCRDNELQPGSPFGNMQESYLHRHHSPFCNPTATPNLPLPVTQLSANGSQMTAEGFVSNAPDVQYMMAIRAENVPNETTNPFILDQYSINQSNSSSSGVGLNGTPIGYGPPFSLNLSSIASTELRNNRYDSSLYSGNPAMKCLSAGGSSSGRGCDGGSGVSETSEAVQCNPQHFKQFYSGPYAGIPVPVEYSPRVFGRAFPQTQESGLTMPVESSTAYSIMNSCCLPDYQHYLHKSSVPESDYGQSIASAHSSVSAVSKPRSNAPVRRPSFRTALDIKPANLTSTLLRDKRGEENEIGNTTPCFLAITPDPSKQAHCNGTGCSLVRRQSQRSRYSPIADEDERAMTPNTNRTRSMESLTEPLLEPPTNFRTTPVRHSNDFECPTKIPESTPENQEMSITKPPDVILKTKNASNFAQFDDADLPPPPIAPLRVLSTASNRISVPSDSRIRVGKTGQAVFIVASENNYVKRKRPHPYDYLDEWPLRFHGTNHVDRFGFQYHPSQADLNKMLVVRSEIVCKQAINDRVRYPKAPDYYVMASRTEICHLFVR
ncbi:hypothetical protein CLF_109973, partial [Clonorchis sinensis]